MMRPPPLRQGGRHPPPPIPPEEGLATSEQVEVTLTPLRDVGALEREWRALEARADGSVFLSWLWIGAWLDGLPAGTRPLVLRGTAREAISGVLPGSAVALGLVLPAANGWLAQRRLLLHETGDPGYDALTIEYNGLLIDRRWHAAAMTACVAGLLRRIGSARVVRLSGLAEPTATALARAAAQAGGGVLRRRTTTVYQVDLTAIRQGGGGGYLATLGAGTRAALRRSLRLYAALGPLTVQNASTVEEALAFYAALKSLHTARWSARGQAGAFASPAVDGFHHRLIARAVPTGMVRLCRIAAGATTIGYLYNLAWGGQVYNYQSGFCCPADNRWKPGLVSHCLAIEDALARGDSLYDFMAGDSGHKPRLAQPAEPMVDLLLLPSARLAHAAEALQVIKAKLSRWKRPMWPAPAVAEPSG